jgi:hypothetical protein
MTHVSASTLPWSSISEPPRGPAFPRPGAAANKHTAERRASRRYAPTWSGLSETGCRGGQVHGRKTGVSEIRPHVARSLRDRVPRRTGTRPEDGRLGDTPPRGPVSPRPGASADRYTAKRRASRRYAPTWSGISKAGCCSGQVHGQKTGVSEIRPHVVRSLRDRVLRQTGTRPEGGRLGDTPPRGPTFPRPGAAADRYTAKRRASWRYAPTWSGISEAGCRGKQAHGRKTGVSEIRGHVVRHLRGRVLRQTGTRPEDGRLGDTPPRGPAFPRPGAAADRYAAGRRASRRYAPTWSGISEAGCCGKQAHGRKTGVSEIRPHVVRSLRDRVLRQTGTRPEDGRLGDTPPHGPVSPRPGASADRYTAGRRASRRYAPTWSGLSETGCCGKQAHGRKTGVSEIRPHVVRSLRDRVPRQTSTRPEDGRLGDTPPRGPASPRPGAAANRHTAGRRASWRYAPTWSGLSETGCRCVN